MRTKTAHATADGNWLRLLSHAANAIYPVL